MNDYTHAHADEFAKAFVKRTREQAKPQGYLGCLLIIAPRATGGADYGALPLSVMPTGRMLVDYLYAYLPAGSTLSVHSFDTRSRASKMPLPFVPAPAALRLVKQPRST